MKDVEPDSNGKLSLEAFTVLMANKMSEKDTKEEILKVIFYAISIPTLFSKPGYFYKLFCHFNSY